MQQNPIITNINITKYRRFQNFQGVTPDFGIYNVIYGWNYSGKTTLSRIFAFYNGVINNKDIDSDAEFYLKTTNLGNLDISKTDAIKVHTFNSDYVKNNLFFEKQSTSNIIVVSDKATETIENIKRLKHKRQNLIKDQTQFTQQYNNYENEYNKKRSNYALMIDGFLPEKFTARNIKSIEDSLNISKLKNYILEDSEKDAKIKTLKNPTTFLKIKKIDEISTINIDELTILLQKSVTPSSVIIKLQEKNAEEWVKYGLSIHQNEDTCLFCGAKLAPEHLKNLDEVFKSEYDNLGQDLQNFDINLNECKIQIPAPATIVDKCRNSYLEVHKTYSDEILKYNNKIRAIKNLIKAKSNNRHLIFQSKLTINTKNLNEIIKDLNQLIDEHNKFIENENDEKKKIKSELKNCIIAELLSDPSYQSTVKGLNDAEIGKTKTEKQIEDLDTQIETEEAKISDVKKGAEEINKILKRLFIGNSNITLKVEKTRNNKGELVDITKLYRNDGKPANNLSDGERTAIAFAHFFTKIQDSINNKTSKDEILFIDDPISSLDKNHIYSISVMIKEVIDRFNQTFVTTHNFELYRLLKRKNNINYYYVKRDGNSSIIEKLPKELEKYDSEYEYFFHKLYNFNKDNTNADIYVIGHCARRFLDNYLQYKIPNNQNPLDKLIKYVKELKEDTTKYTVLYRIVNDESHVHPEILFDKGYLIGAVALLLDTIEKHDKLHYNTLKESCNIAD